MLLLLGMYLVDRPLFDGFNGNPENFGDGNIYCSSKLDHRHVSGLGEHFCNRA